MSIWFVGAVLALSISVVFVKHVDRVLGILLTASSLRKVGVDAKEIHKIVLAEAKRERRHIVLQVLDRVIDFSKSRKP